MIVLDENLHDQRILASVAAWYPGRVVSIVALRPRSVIKDDAVPALLRKAARPTFVTINVGDFWKKIDPHASYCIVNVALPREQLREVPDFLYRLFHVPDFRTKSLRMGRIVHLTPRRIEYYRSDWVVHILPWPDL